MHDELERVRTHAEAAGRAPELDVLVQRVEETTDRERVLESLAEDIEDLTPADATTAPYLLVGTADEMAAQLRRQADELGITRVVVRRGDVATLAPLLPALR